MKTLVYLLLASLTPLPWAATPTRRQGGRRTPPTKRPEGEDRREEGGRRGRKGRAVEEGVGCQEERTQGADYSGTANTTIGGLTCQAWSVQEPHQHGLSHYGDHNYCRFLDGFPGGVWCYTTDPDIRFDFCPVMFCETGNLGFPI